MAGWRWLLILAFRGYPSRMKCPLLAPLFFCLGLLTACSAAPKRPNLSRIYKQASDASKDTRHPVIVIPGIMGSRLTNSAGKKVWGAFTHGAVDPDYPEGARTIALPMQTGIPLSKLRDDVIASEVLDVLVADIGPLRGLNFAAYVGILNVLNVGGFRDRSFGESGAIDYGGAHYTCYQYPYDWRRDISESAAGLGRFVRSSQEAVRAARGLATDEPVRVDVVAHSMGGLVLRYYLRYGEQPLPRDGSSPRLTWAGAKNVRHAILVGTPNAGSALALEQLTTGLDLNPLFPYYRPSVLGTMPAIYQLLPRSRHGAVVDEHGKALDLFNIETWKRYGWGLANPESDKALAWLLPEQSDEQRSKVALDHLQKSLLRAAQLQRALDRPFSPPAETRISLFAGDALETITRWKVKANGKLRRDETEAGDGTVARYSALMDERQGQPYSTGLRSAVNWDRVQFLFSDHVGLTASEEFTDNMLYLLLEERRKGIN